jgi:hypothetical protein
MAEFVKPFGPSIMIDNVSETLVRRFNELADRALADEEACARLDVSSRLAGNVHKEISLPFDDDADRERAFAELKGKVLEYYNHLRPQANSGTMPPIDATRITISGMWVVSQLAGDFNPLHKHGGDFSAVIYLRLPPGLAGEWEEDDHYPTAGLIEFTDGRPNRFARTGYRVRPRPGMLLLFPAWLLHTVRGCSTPCIPFAPPVSDSR